jgi:hypothetical protein
MVIKNPKKFEELKHDKNFVDYLAKNIRHNVIAPRWLTKRNHIMSINDRMTGMIQSSLYGRLNKGCP